MKHIIEDHEEVRQWVEKETGGFVEKIYAVSDSEYHPTLDSLEGRGLKPNPTFVPRRYDARYDVRVVVPPKGRVELLKIVRAVDVLHIVARSFEAGW